MGKKYKKGQDEAIRAASKKSGVVPWIRHLEIKGHLDDTRPLGLTYVAIPKVVNTAPKSTMPNWYFEAMLCSTKSPLVIVHVKSKDNHASVRSVKFDTQPTVREIAKAVLATYDESLLEVEDVGQEDVVQEDAVQEGAVQEDAVQEDAVQEDAVQE